VDSSLLLLSASSSTVGRDPTKAKRLSILSLLVLEVGEFSCHSTTPESACGFANQSRAKAMTRLTQNSVLAEQPPVPTTTWLRGVIAHLCYGSGFEYGAALLTATARQVPLSLIDSLPFWSHSHSPKTLGLPCAQEAEWQEPPM
jgi:hypothetical protein